MQHETIDPLASETGSRRPGGRMGRLVFLLALAWSLFQLWYASPLPFWFADFIPVLNDTQARSLHLAWGLGLVFLLFPAFRSKARDTVPPGDWILAVAGIGSAGYLFWFNAELAGRPGLPTTADLWAGVTGLVLLLEAARRSLGPPLVVVAFLFIVYIFFGHLAPDMIAWKGASLSRAISHLWLSTEGVFGIALGVSTGTVFMFVLFGALLEKSGAGQYFINMAFALVGHMRGGPAKAAVLASGLTGLVSGSSIANTVTTGTFTIPLMKKVGFSAEKAGAVEVASSVNGQIMPPVMGAAAFLMVEYTGIAYVDVIRHAFLPATLSYIALVYIVHLEAVRAALPVLARRTPLSPVAQRLLHKLLALSGFMIFVGGAYLVLTGAQTLLGVYTGPVIGGGLVGLYLVLAWLAARQPDIRDDSFGGEGEEKIFLPAFRESLYQGLHYFLPIGVLVWALTVERLSPGLSAFWASMVMIAILLTQRVLVCVYRGRKTRHDLAETAWRGVSELVSGLEAGARNMIVIAVATAAAGIIVGAVSLTGIGQVLSDVVELASGGNLVLILIYVAILSLILGMGLPTTANYIVVSALMAGIIVELGAQSGLVVPLIAVHLFVFYFGVMADVTPPVGLASFAAAAISGGDPVRTGVTAFRYALRTVVLPFVFIFNTKLLWMGIAGPVDLLLTIVTALMAILVFTSATQNYLLVRNRWWETLFLLLAAFTLFCPQYWVDRIIPPAQRLSFFEAETSITHTPENDRRVFIFSGENLEGEEIRRFVSLPLGKKAAAAARLEEAGITLRRERDRVFVEDVAFASPAEKLGVDFDFEIIGVEIPNAQFSPYWMAFPALAVISIVILVQRRRWLAGG